MTYNVHHAKTHLSRLLQQVEGGEEVILCRAGKPVARLVPMTPLRERTPGRWAGRIQIGEAFEEPLAAEVLAGWEDGPIEP